jgi:hypothetical protein
MPQGDGLTEEDPLYLKMKEIIWSAEGKQAALDSTRANLPALCGVDLLLQKRLPNEHRRYTPANTGPQLPLVVSSEVAIMEHELG